jgi:hypothetical protein
MAGRTIGIEGSYSRLREGKMGRGGGSMMACTRCTRAGCARPASRSGAASGGVSEHGQSQLRVKGLNMRFKYKSRA